MIWRRFDGLWLGFCGGEVRWKEDRVVGQRDIMAGRNKGLRHSHGFCYDYDPNPDPDPFLYGFQK